MSKNRLAVVIVVCTIAIIAAIVLFGLKPWEGTREETPSIETYTLSIGVCPSRTGCISPSGGEYAFGQHVTLTAYPASNYTFDYWSGDASGNSTTITITMNHNYYITANFASTALHPLMLISPQCRALNVPTNGVLFCWTLRAEADEFYFVLSANPDLSAPIAEAPGLNYTAYEYSEHLDYGTYYYWQVKALKEDSVISESSIEVFRTGEISEPGL